MHYKNSVESCIFWDRLVYQGSSENFFDWAKVWYMRPFLLEAIEASGCYFFLNRMKKLKCPNFSKPLGTINQKNIDPSEPISFIHFTLIHPINHVIQQWLKYFRWEVDLAGSAKFLLLTLTQKWEDTQLLFFVDARANSQCS